MANEEIQVPDVTVRGFWARIEKGDDCWLWRGAMRPNGYGGYVMNRVPVYAHRLSWQIHHGPIPAGLFVCHRCDVKRCVRPDHLFLGTRQENMDDMKRKGRQAHGPTHVARARVSAVKGSAHYNAKLSDEKVVAIRHRRAAGEMLKSIAKDMGVNIRAVSKVVHGKRWAHVQEAG